MRVEVGLRTVIFLLLSLLAWPSLGLAAPTDHCLADALAELLDIGHQERVWSPGEVIPYVRQQLEWEGIPFSAEDEGRYLVEDYFKGPIVRLIAEAFVSETIASDGTRGWRSAIRKLSHFLKRPLEEQHLFVDYMIERMVLIMEKDQLANYLDARQERHLHKHLGTSQSEAQRLAQVWKSMKPESYRSLRIAILYLLKKRPTEFLVQLKDRTSTWMRFKSWLTGLDEIRFPWARRSPIAPLTSEQLAHGLSAVEGHPLPGGPPPPGFVVEPWFQMNLRYMGIRELRWLQLSAASYSIEFRRLVERRLADVAHAIKANNELQKARLFGDSKGLAQAERLYRSAITALDDSSYLRTGENRLVEETRPRFQLDNDVEEKNETRTNEEALDEIDAFLRAKH